MKGIGVDRFPFGDGTGVNPHGYKDGAVWVEARRWAGEPVWYVLVAVSKTSYGIIAHCATEPMALAAAKAARKKR
jgi:hypothetical protein